MRSKILSHWHFTACAYLFAIIGMARIVAAEEDERLAESLQPILAAHEGTVTVAIKHLTSGATFLHRADEPMPTASLIKFPVMIAAYQKAADGKLDLSTMVELKEA